MATAPLSSTALAIPALSSSRKADSTRPPDLASPPLDPAAAAPAMLTSASNNGYRETFDAEQKLFAVLKPGPSPWPTM